jgi:hypothetical protein
VHWITAARRALPTRAEEVTILTDTTSDEFDTALHARAAAGSQASVRA